MINIPEELPSNNASVFCTHGAIILTGSHWADDPMVPTGDHLACLDEFFKEEKARQDEALKGLLSDWWRDHSE